MLGWLHTPKTLYGQHKLNKMNNNKRQMEGNWGVGLGGFAGRVNMMKIHGMKFVKN